VSTALQSRLVHLRVRPDNKGWLDWARANGIDYRITSFIEFKPKNLYTFDPEKSEAQDTYACYRTWEFADRQLKQIPDIDKEPNARAIFAGSLSEGVAREFLAYLKVFTKIPTFTQIIANPTGIKLPSEPGHLYALSGTLGQNVDNTNISPVMECVSRLPNEFQVITLREMFRRNQTILQEQPVQDWVKLHGKEFYQ
jgi:hypothetical protein